MITLMHKGPDKGLHKATYIVYANKTSLSLNIGYITSYLLLDERSLTETYDIHKRSKMTQKFAPPMKF